MIRWPDELVSALARRRAVLFLGAGVSRNAVSASGERPPMWHDFLHAGIKRCAGSKVEIKRLLENGDLFTCCQLIKQRLDHAWIPFLEEKFFFPGFEVRSIHKHIFELDAHIVLTPNFDKIYDNYATAATGSKVRIKKYHDPDLARFLRGSEKQRLVLKVHGCIDTPGSLVFTRADYVDLRSKYDNFYRAIEALILANTFIFIGCGGAGPDISLLLEQYARSFRDSPPNYFITSSKWSKDYALMMNKNYNLVPVCYSEKNEHAELTDSLAVLVQKVDERRSQLAASALW